MSAKYLNFLEQLTNVVNSLDTTKVKSTLGDSTQNHRVLTVRQVIRFLNETGNRTQLRLARKLSSVYEIVRPSIKVNRSEGRSDAVDINEFLNFYTSKVVNRGLLRNQISRSI